MTGALVREAFIMEGIYTEDNVTRQLFFLALMSE